jgi:hypothetical protein
VISAATGYGIVSIQMVLYGIGMGFTAAPATESIMGAVSKEKAGVGSAVNDTTRLLGGTLGVAVIGSIYASVYNGRLATGLPASLPRALTQTAHQSVGGALAVAGRLGAVGQHHVAAVVHQAASNAFIHGLSIGCLVAGGVAAAGALMAAALLPAQPAAATLPNAGTMPTGADQMPTRALAGSEPAPYPEVAQAPLETTR